MSTEPTRSDARTSHWPRLAAALVVFALVGVGALLLPTLFPGVEPGPTTPSGADAVDDEREQPAAHDPRLVRIATGEWAPYFDSQRADAGLAIEACRQALALDGYRIELVWRPWKRAIDETASGRWDATALWGLTDERRARFLVTQPVFAARWVFFHRRDRPFDWETLDDLKGLTIGATREYAYTERFYAAAETGALDVEWVANDTLNYRKLLHGRLDIFPQDELVGRHELREKFDGRASEITSHPRPLRLMPLHLLVSKDAPHAAEIVAAFDRGLARLRSEGTIDEILADPGGADD